MIENNIKLADIYYKNFGYDNNNNIKYFDFHNIEDFTTSSNNFIITNLFCIFHYYFIPLIPIIPIIGNENEKEKEKIFKSSEIISDDLNFGKSIFPKPFYELLISIYNINNVDSYNNLKNRLSIEIIINIFQ